MTDLVALRVLSCDLAGVHDRASLTTLIRSLAPDVVVLQHGPRRLRWRTRGAMLADRFGLVVGGGGEPALGNLILVSLRIAVQDTSCVQFPLVAGRAMSGAAMVRGTVRGSRFAVAGTAVSREPEAAILDRVLSEVDIPTVLAAEFGGADGAARKLLARGLIDGGALGRTSAIFVSPGVAVRDCREVAVAGAAVSPIVAELALPAPDAHSLPSG